MDHCDSDSSSGSEFSEGSTSINVETKRMLRRASIRRSLSQYLPESESESATTSGYSDESESGGSTPEKGSAPEKFVVSMDAGRALRHHREKASKKENDMERFLVRVQDRLQNLLDVSEWFDEKDVGPVLADLISESKEQKKNISNNHHCLKDFSIHSTALKDASNRLARTGLEMLKIMHNMVADYEMKRSKAESTDEQSMEVKFFTVPQLMQNMNNWEDSIICVTQVLDACKQVTIVPSDKEKMIQVLDNAQVLFHNIVETYRSLSPEKLQLSDRTQECESEENKLVSTVAEVQRDTERVEQLKTRIPELQSEINKATAGQGALKKQISKAQREIADKETVEKPDPQKAMRKDLDKCKKLSKILHDELHRMKRVLDTKVSPEVIEDHTVSIESTEKLPGRTMVLSFKPAAHSPSSSLSSGDDSWLEKMLGATREESTEMESRTGSPKESDGMTERADLLSVGLPEKNVFSSTKEDTSAFKAHAAGVMSMVSEGTEYSGGRLQERSVSASRVEDNSVLQGQSTSLATEGIIDYVGGRLQDTGTCQVWLTPPAAEGGTDMCVINGGLTGRIDSVSGRPPEWSLCLEEEDSSASQGRSIPPVTECRTDVCVMSDDMTERTDLLGGRMPERSLPPSDKEEARTLQGWPVSLKTEGGTDVSITSHGMKKRTPAGGKVDGFMVGSSKHLTSEAGAHFADRSDMMRPDSGQSARKKKNTSTAQELWKRLALESVTKRESSSFLAERQAQRQGVRDKSSRSPVTSRPATPILISIQDAEDEPEIRSWESITGSGSSGSLSSTDKSVSPDPSGGRLLERTRSGMKEKVTQRRSYRSVMDIVATLRTGSAVADTRSLPSLMASEQVLLHSRSDQSPKSSSESDGSGPTTPTITVTQSAEVKLSKGERSVPQSETLARATGHRAQHHFDGGTHGYQRQSEEPKHRQSRLEQNKSSHAKSDSGEVISNESESIGVDQLVSISTPQLSLHADSNTLSRSSSGYTDRYRAPEVSPTAVGAAMEGVGVGARCFMGMRETTVGELRRQHLADYADVMDCLVGCDIEADEQIEDVVDRLQANIEPTVQDFQAVVSNAVSELKRMKNESKITPTGHQGMLSPLEAFNQANDKMKASETDYAAQLELYRKLWLMYHGTKATLITLLSMSKEAFARVPIREDISRPSSPTMSSHVMTTVAFQPKKESPHTSSEFPKVWKDELTIAKEAFDSGKIAHDDILEQVTICLRMAALLQHKADMLGNTFPEIRLKQAFCARIQDILNEVSMEKQELRRWQAKAGIKKYNSMLDSLDSMEKSIRIEQELTWVQVAMNKSHKKIRNTLQIEMKYHTMATIQEETESRSSSDEDRREDVEGEDYGKETDFLKMVSSGMRQMPFTSRMEEQIVDKTDLPPHYSASQTRKAPSMSLSLESIHEAQLDHYSEKTFSSIARHLESSSSSQLLLVDKTDLPPHYTSSQTRKVSSSSINLDMVPEIEMDYYYEKDARSPYARHLDIVSSSQGLILDSTDLLQHHSSSHSRRLSSTSSSLDGVRGLDLYYDERFDQSSSDSGEEVQGISLPGLIMSATSLLVPREESGLSRSFVTDSGRESERSYLVSLSPQPKIEVESSRTSTAKVLQKPLVPDLSIQPADVSWLHTGEKKVHGESTVPTVGLVTRRSRARSKALDLPSYKRRTSPSISHRDRSILQPYAFSGSLRQIPTTFPSANRIERFVVSPKLPLIPPIEDRPDSVSSRPDEVETPHSPTALREVEKPIQPYWDLRKATLPTLDRDSRDQQQRQSNVEVLEVEDWVHRTTSHPPAISCKLPPAKSLLRQRKRQTRFLNRASKKRLEQTTPVEKNVSPISGMPYPRKKTTCPGWPTEDPGTACILGSRLHFLEVDQTRRKARRILQSVRDNRLNQLNSNPSCQHIWNKFSGICPR